MRDFVCRLLASDRREIDELIVLGLLAMVGLVCMSAYDLVVNHGAWSAVSFGTAAAGVIGATGTACGARDRLSGPPQPPQQ